MPSRFKSRQRALQILFQWDVASVAAPVAIANFSRTLHSEADAPGALDADPFMESLVNGVVSRVEEIDGRIRRHAQHWRLDRMAAVDRNLLRMAIFEMEELGTPPAVVIDQALELAKRFSGDDAAAFINGVLDAVRKDLEQERSASGGASAPG
jgi:transcription antitermination protein NusB